MSHGAQSRVDAPGNRNDHTLGASGPIRHTRKACPLCKTARAAAGFRDRFEAKGRFQSYLKAIPTYVITHPAAALIGLKSLVEARG
ncbi:MAG: glucokinase [Xanthobacteraceae bacterium]